MKRVLFTKLFLGKPIEEVAAVGSRLGFDGIDLLVRKGFQVEPGDPAGIAVAVKLLNDAGLSVPMATTDITDPSSPIVEPLFAAFAEQGINVIRLGYWKYDPAIGYLNILGKAQKDLEGLAKLAEAAGVTLSIQLHGDTIHNSGATTYNLLKDHDPKVMGVYPDPGNQHVQDGREDWRFTFDILKPWLNAVGMKNGGWFPAELRPSGQRVWKSDWYGLPDGHVPWDEIVPHLVSTGFDGLLTFHSHYEVPYKQVLDQTATDLNYIDALIEGAQA
jgi:sugar phosphate isomerase/epimerase